MPGLPIICTGCQSFSVPNTRKLTRPRLAGSNLLTTLPCVSSPSSARTSLTLFNCLLSYCITRPPLGRT